MLRCLGFNLAPYANLFSTFVPITFRRVSSSRCGVGTFRGFQQFNALLYIQISLYAGSKLVNLTILPRRRKGIEVDVGTIHIAALGRFDRAERVLRLGTDDVIVKLTDGPTVEHTVKQLVGSVDDLGIDGLLDEGRDLVILVVTGLADFTRPLVELTSPTAVLVPPMSMARAIFSIRAAPFIRSCPTCSAQRPAPPSDRPALPRKPAGCPRGWLSWRLRLPGYPPECPAWPRS